MTYSISFLLHWAFNLTGQASLVKIHPIVGGWMAIVKDERSGQLYKMHIEPIKSEKIVVPDTVEQLLDRGALMELYMKLMKATNAVDGNIQASFEDMDPKIIVEKDGVPFVDADAKTVVFGHGEREIEYSWDDIEEIIRSYQEKNRGL